MNYENLNLCDDMSSNYDWIRVLYGQSYQYPVKPGDQKWKEFKSSDEMYEACQIPDDVLLRMSTKDLVETCLNYPLISTLYAYNDLQKGFFSLAKRFNGFEELAKRKDSGSELMKVYDKMLPNSFGKNWSLERTGKFILEFTYIETLLAQRDIQSNLSMGEKKKLMSICLEKYYVKQKHTDIHDTHGIMNTVWVMGRIMEKQDEANNNVSSGYELARYAFIEQGLLTDLEVADDIVEQAKEYIR